MFVRDLDRRSTRCPSTPTKIMERFVQSYPEQHLGFDSEKVGDDPSTRLGR
jgi:hypothetical protein